MKDEYILIKNGLLLTLDRRGTTGYYNLLIRNGKINLIDYENKFNFKEFLLKYTETKVIDAKNKIVMPGFINSGLISSYTFNKYFFKKCNYENINSWLSLKLTDKFLSVNENSDLLNDLLRISFLNSLQNGELLINESSTGIKKEFFDRFITAKENIKQYFNLTVYDFTLLTNPAHEENFISLGFKADEDINNYSLSSIKKVVSGNKLRLFIEASLSQKTYESVKKVFGKPFINVLSEMELISSSTVISNPTHITRSEIEILKEKKSTVMISPSDFMNFHDKIKDLENIIYSGVNIIIGTGYTGNSIFSEIKLLSQLISKSSISAETLLKYVIKNPAGVFGISNLTGSIERNKSADLILLDLNNLRNVLSIPEISSEILSEFIINKLSEKDISDVILKGEILIENGKYSEEEINADYKNAIEISEKIYKEGKYFEYKEKYLMRGRVDNMNLENEGDNKNVSEEIYVDTTFTGDIILDEGTFTIVGAKEDEFENLREKVKKEDVNENINEIKSLEDGINLFENIEDLNQMDNSFSKRKENIKERAGDLELKINLSKVKDNLTEKEKNNSEEDENNNLNEAVNEISLQKKKLKFGFTDEEKKNNSL